MSDVSPDASRVRTSRAKRGSARSRSKAKTAFAYFLVHAPVNFFPIVNRGEPAVLLCFILLYMSAAGAGQYSIDALWSARRQKTPPAQGD